MRHALATLAGAAALAVAAPATGQDALDDDVIRVPSPHSVAQTVARLTEAVEEAGATVFAEVPHSAGAQSIGEELAPMTLVIFGNPQIGTPILQADPAAGLDLPLRVLVYEDGAADTWLLYTDPAVLEERYIIDGTGETIAAMTGALENLTAAAAGED